MERNTKRTTHTQINYVLSLWLCCAKQQRYVCIPKELVYRIRISLNCTTLLCIHVIMLYGMCWCWSWCLLADGIWYGWYAFCTRRSGQSEIETEATNEKSCSMNAFACEFPKQKREKERVTRPSSMAIQFLFQQTLLHLSETHHIRYNTSLLLCCTRERENRAHSQAKSLRLRYYM